MKLYQASLRHWSGLALLPPLLLSWSLAGAIELDQALELALERDEGLNALSLRRAALEQGAVADGALPDPEILIGVEGVPIDDPLGSDMMTMYMVGLRQSFPAGHSRRLMSDRTLAESVAIGIDAQSRRLEIQREVRLAWLNWVGQAEAIEVAEAGLAAFSELVELTEARYRAGTGRQRDVDQARLEQALMARQILDLETRRDEAASQLARWIGRWPEQDQEARLPDWPAPGSQDAASAGWQQHPAILSDGQRIEAGRLGADLARQAYRPMWMVEAGYGHQRGRDPMGMGRQSDKLFAMVSFSLPLFTANRQDRRVAAAEAEVDALVHQRQLRIQEWEGRIRGQQTRLERQQRRIELLAEIILPEAERTVDSTLAAYRTDRASFDEVVRARLAEIDQRLELIATRINWLEARTELAYLNAEDLP